MKLGRNRPRVKGPCLRYGNYLMRNIPPSPATVDYMPAAFSCLDQVFKNDQLGDCTAAAAYHVAGTLLANAGKPTFFTDDDVVKFYSATTGYDPANPASDQGGDELTVLNYWQQKGLDGKGGHAIAAYFSVDATDIEEVKHAIYTFGNVYFGCELPDAFVNAMPAKSGFTFDSSGLPDPNNGHAFCGLGYNMNGVRISTWGMTGLITWAAVQAYAGRAAGGELYTVLSWDALNQLTQKGPSGLDRTQMIADVDAVFGAKL